MSAPIRASVILCAVVTVLAACAGAPPDNSPADTASGAAPGDASFDAPMVESGEPVPPLSESEKTTECRYMRVTGSHMMQKVCRTAEQRRQEEEASRQWMRTRGRSGGVSKVRDVADPRDDDE